MTQIAGTVQLHSVTSDFLKAYQCITYFSLCSGRLIIAYLYHLDRCFEI